MADLEVSEVVEGDINGPPSSGSNMYIDNGRGCSHPPHQISF